MTDEQLEVILDALDRGEEWPWELRFPEHMHEQIMRAVDARIAECEGRAREAMRKLIEHRQRQAQ